MTAVETGTLLLSEAEARAMTEQIREAAEALWSLLVEMHDREGWRALGYADWSSYVEGELTITRSQSYRLLDQGRVITELEAAGVSRARDTVTQRAAQDIRDDVPAVAADAKAAVAAGADERQAMREAVERGRGRAAERRATPEDLKRRLTNASHGKGLFPTGRARELLREIARQLLEAMNGAEVEDIAARWQAALGCKSNVPALERMLGEIESVEDRAASGAPGDVQEADATSDEETIEGPSGNGASPSDENEDHDEPRTVSSDVEDADNASDGDRQPAMPAREDGASYGGTTGVLDESADGSPAVDPADAPPSAAPSDPEPDALPPAGSGSGSGYGNTEVGTALASESKSKPKIDAVGIGRSVFAAMSVGIPENVDHIAAGIRTLPSDERELLRERATRSKAQAERVLFTLDTLEKDGLA